MKHTPRTPAAIIPIGCTKVPVWRKRSNGKPGYYVNKSHFGMEGIWHRPSVSELQRLVTDHADAFQKFGANGHIPDDRRMELIQASDKAAKLGCTLDEALRFWETHAKRLKPMELDEAVIEFLGAWAEAGRRGSYVKLLAKCLEDLVSSLGDSTPCHLITLAQIKDWATAHHWDIATKKRRYGDLNVFFKFCQKHGWVTGNPMGGLEEIFVNKKRPTILAVDQCRALLDRALATDPPMIPYLAVQMFGGLRREEAQTLTPDRIKPEHIDLDDTALIKTRDWRLVPINDTLRSWLAAGPHEFPPLNEHDRWADLKAIIKPWPRNAIRHTAATMMLYKYGTAKAALMLGHSESTLHHKYKGRISELADVDKFWALTPESFGVSP